MTERPHRRLCPTDDAREVPGAISGGCFSLPSARAEIQLKIAARSNLFVNTNAGARECRTNCWPRSHPSQWAAGSPVSALVSAQVQRNPPQLACRADPGTQKNPGASGIFGRTPLPLTAPRACSRRSQSCREVGSNRVRHARRSYPRARLGQRACRQRPPHSGQVRCALRRSRGRNQSILHEIWRI